MIVHRVGRLTEQPPGMARQKECNMVATASTLSPVTLLSSTLECRIATSDLKRAVATLARIADRRSSMPMLQTILIRVGDDGLTFAATDLNTSVVLVGASAASIGRGAVCVNAKSLADLVKTLSGDEVTLSQSGPCGLKVTDGQSDITLIGMNARDFPKVPDASAPGIEFHRTEGVAFADMLDRVAYSVCKDETRFHLNGVLIECDGQTTRMVTTDGHRLTRHDAKLWGAPTKGVILPGKAASEIAKLMKSEKGATAYIAIKEHMFHVKVGGWLVSTKLIDAQFPAYEQVIPKDHKKLATVEVKPLIAALKRAAKLTSETRGVLLSFASGKLTLTCDHPEAGTASETIKACSEWLDGGGKGRFGVNAKYLLDILGEIGDRNVTITFDGELDPILVRGTDDSISHTVQSSRYLGVVMPMRI